MPLEQKQSLHTPASPGNARYCLERVAGEFIAADVDGVKAKLDAMSDEKLLAVCERVLAARDTTMPRLRQLMEKLAEPGHEETAPCRTESKH